MCVTPPWVLHCQPQWSLTCICLGGRNISLHASAYFFLNSGVSWDLWLLTVGVFSPSRWAIWIESKTIPVAFSFMWLTSGPWHTPHILYSEKLGQCEPPSIAISPLICHRSGHLSQPLESLGGSQSPVHSVFQTQRMHHRLRRRSHWRPSLLTWDGGYLHFSPLVGVGLTTQQQSLKNSFSSTNF